MKREQKHNALYRVLDKVDVQLGEITKHPTTYHMGIDTYDINVSSYCLVKKHKDISEIIICKSMTDYDEFELEYKNLCRYFDAELIEEI